MKICLLCYRGNPYSGGQGIYLKYIAEELVRQGHTVHAISGPPYPETMKGVTLHQIPNNQYFIRKGKNIIESDRPFSIFSPINFYEYLHSRAGAFPEISSFSYRAFMLVRSLHKKYNFDIIHDNQSLGYGLLLMKYLNIPVVATIHHPLSIDLVNVLERMGRFKSKVKTVIFYPILMQTIVSKHLDHIITVSNDSKKQIMTDFGVALNKQTVIYNGIDRDIFYPEKGVKRIKGKILFVGNIEDGKKGFVYLLKALSHIGQDINLTVVDGGAPHRKITDRLIERLNLTSQVRFTGKTSVDGLRRHYCEAEITIVPSVYEGFGFPAAEAMACGSPVISSNGGALPEVIGDAGIIVPVRKEIPLAKAINELLKDAAKRQKLSDAGIVRVREHFDWRKCVREMVDVYQKVLKKRKR